jgi:NhaP-type Na+/H+ or K+/H+ antiporter
MWRLILTTGLGGTVLCLSFFAMQFLRRARGPSPLDVTTCTVLLVAVLCFFVYDSLGSAMFTALIAVGLMARADEPSNDVPVSEVPT